MSMIAKLQTYIKTYGSLESGAAVNVDYLEKDPVAYSIVPLPGARIVEEHIDGSSLREYPFALQFVEVTSGDAQRLESNGWCEDFADWLESQTEAGTLPTLDTGRTAEEIEALGWGYLFQQGESQTGIYQVQCRLTYEQDAP